MKIKLILGLLPFVSLNAFAFNFDANVPMATQNQIKEDLKFVSGIEGSNQTDLHKQIFGEVSGNAYEHFFNSRITDIGMHHCGSQNAVACVIPYFSSSKMWITKNYVKFSHPQIARLMIIFHESRHTEDQNDNWPHANCPMPFEDSAGKPIQSIWTGAELAGEAACDETPYGSYGSSLILLKNISKYCTNCTDKVKMDAQIYGDDQFKRIIDEKAKKQIQDDLYQS